MTCPSQARLKAACETLSLADPALARAYDLTGLPVWRAGDPTYAMLARMITHQQISLGAAAAIWARTEALLGAVTPEAVLAADPEALRACGQSRPKVGHLVSIDAFPVGDVGLMEAHKRLSGHETRMDIKGFTAHAERWRPHRGVAAHLLWAWLHLDRGDAAPSPS